MRSLYVHIPFCLSKCYYCDFVSTVHESQLAERYTTALCREAELWSALLQDPSRLEAALQEIAERPASSDLISLAQLSAAPPASGAQPNALLNTPAGADGRASAGISLTPLETVFFGGGTPTTLSVGQLMRILATVQSRFGLALDAEVSIEANPRTHAFTAPGPLDQLREAGFNRLSLGAQTFDDDLLRVIGRGHTSRDVQAAIHRARQAGFENLSVDLIFALPGQTLDGWRDTLRRAIDLGTEHISLYNLTIEEGTVFGEQYRRGELEPAPSDLEAEMFTLAIEEMTAAGFEQYEVSNFARVGSRCRHNQVYWRREDYLGIGVGAHSCLGAYRFASGRNTAQHVQKVEAEQLPILNVEQLAPDAMAGEALWLGLRLLEGVDLRHFGERYGRGAIEQFREPIDRLTGRGLTRLEGDRLSLTAEGLFLGNEVFCEFV